MLRSHIDTIESVLLETSKVPANAGHSLHKGTPRESFIRNFLDRHLSEEVAIGTGEIVAASSKPDTPRNQLDIVVYRRSFPRLDFGGGITGFLAESVIATISVKSKLKKSDFVTEMRTAARVKSLQRHVHRAGHAGYVPPAILNYIVAYDGPRRVSTIYNWINGMRDEIFYPPLPLDLPERTRVAAPSIDAVFVLGRGFVHYGNTPVGFLHEKLIRHEPQSRWVIADMPRGSLLLLFLFLTVASSGSSFSWLDPLPYLEGFTVEAYKTRIGM